MTLSVVLPAYKEAENLGLLLPKIKENLDKLNIENYEILIIDTMETMDSTEKVCLDNNVNYYHREDGNTYGDAIKTGIAKANNDFLLIMDADRFA